MNKWELSPVCAWSAAGTPPCWCSSQRRTCRRLSTGQKPLSTPERARPSPYWSKCALPDSRRVEFLWRESVSEYDTALYQNGWFAVLEYGECFLGLFPTELTAQNTRLRVIRTLDSQPPNFKTNNNKPQQQTGAPRILSRFYCVRFRACLPNLDAQIQKTSGND